MKQVLGIRNLSYRAFADDAAGTGFTLNNDPAKDYMAIITSPVVLDPPTAADFEGEWFKRKGEKGDQGDQGIQGIQGVSGPTFQLLGDPRSANPNITFDENYTQGPDDISANLALSVDAGVDGKELYWIFQLTNSAALSLSADFKPMPGSLLPGGLSQNTPYLMKMRYLNFRAPYLDQVLYTISPI